MRKPRKLAIKMIDDYVYIAKENEVMHTQIVDRIQPIYEKVLGEKYAVKNTGYASKEGYDTDFSGKYFDA